MKCPLCKKHDLVRGQVTEVVCARDEEKRVYKAAVTMDCNTCPTCGAFVSHDEMMLASLKVLRWFKNN